MQNVVGYVRVSTLEQDESIKAQTEKIAAYCTMRGLNLVHVYVDFGVSGSVPLEDREHGKDMLGALKSRSKDRPTGVVSVRLDRMFRSAVDCLNNVETWKKTGVGLHLIDMGGTALDTSSAAGEMFIVMLAGMAQFERRLIGERTAAVLLSKKNRGEVFNHTPLGYDRDGDKLITNETEQAIIARIRTMRGAGMSMNRIADALNAEGIQGKNGGKWYACTVRNVLNAA